MKELMTRRSNAHETPKAETELIASIENALTASAQVIPQALERWEQQVSGVQRSKAGAEIDLAARAALAHVGSVLEQKRQTAFDALRGLVSKYPRLPFVIGLTAAMSAHVPIVKDVEPFKTGIEDIQKLAKNISLGHPEWGMYDKVYSPQSAEEALSVAKKIAERKKQEDQEGLNSYKKRAEESIEMGKTPHLKDMVFEMERLSGVPPEKIDQAKKIAEAMIARYAAKAREKGKIDEAFLGELTAEAFGGETVYEWGQASVTDFFVSKKRNCVAVDYAQEMVIEEAIEALPESERQRYSFGSNEVKQHVRTVVTISLDSISRSFLLDGEVVAIPVEQGNAPQRSATIDSLTLKKSLVTANPIEIDAIPAAPGSPKEMDTLIVTVSNEPLKRNIKIRGELGNSDFVQNQLKIEQIEPVHLSKAAEEQLKNWKDTAKAEDIIQIELPEKTATEIINEILSDTQKTLDTGMSPYEAWVDIREEVQLQSAAEVDRMNTALVDKNLTSVSIGDTSSWSADAVKQLARKEYLSIGIQPDQSGSFDQRMIEEWKKTNADPGWDGNQITGGVLEIFSFSKNESAFLGTGDAREQRLQKFPMKKDSLRELVKNLPPRFSELDIRWLEDRMDPEHGNYAEALESLPRPTTMISYADMYLKIPNEVREKLRHRMMKFVFPIDEYMKIAKTTPDIELNLLLDVWIPDVRYRDLTVLSSAYNDLVDGKIPDSKKHQEVRGYILDSVERVYRIGFTDSERGTVQHWLDQEKNLQLRKRLENILTFPSRAVR